jgi:hypothetical protein
MYFYRGSHRCMSESLMIIMWGIRKKLYERYSDSNLRWAVDKTSKQKECYDIQKSEPI